MKTTISVVIILLTVTLSFGGDLNPPSGSPVPTMKTLDEVEPRITINQDNTPSTSHYVYRITEPGSYYLTENITTDTLGGIRISSSDVTVDLNGFAVKATGTAGYSGCYISDCENIVITNGSFEGFANGIRNNGNNAAHFRIENVRSISNQYTGFYITGYASDTTKGGLMFLLPVP